MKVEIQELDPCKRQLVVEAPEEEVRAAWTAACGRVQRDARLPGFRRGKVPMTLVRSRFGDEVRQAVAEALIPVVYRRAVDETQIRPVEDPEFRELQLEEGQPLRFTAVVEIKPAIALGEYRGVTARHSPRPVTEDDVERTLTAIAEQRATLVTATRAARVGDFVVSMSVVQPDADILVLTETGYGKRVPLTEFRTMHRGSQGVRLISLEGKKTGDVAAVQQVTELDEELLLISAGGQVVRTDVTTINRQKAQARGVITMRMNEGDRVVAISAFRAGLADRDGIEDNDAPEPGSTPTPDGGPAPGA